MPDRRAPPTRLMMRKPKRASSQPELIRCIEDGIDRSGDNTTGLQASARSAPGHTIKITEQRATDSGFVARLSLDDGAQYPIMITNPLECAGEEDLDAYFQAYSKPFSDSRPPERGTCSVADYGKALFEQIFVHEREWLAKWYLKMKDFQAAKGVYQSVLAIYRCLEGDSKLQMQGLGSTYHQMGVVAQELGELSQASTYFALGALDEMQRNYDGARANVRRGLQILEEFHDQRVVAIATRWLNRMQMDAGNEAGMDGDMAAEANDRMGRDPIDDMEADASRAEDVRVSGKPIKRCQLWWKMAVKRFSRSWRPGKVGSNPQHDYSGRLTRVFSWQGVERRGANMSTKSELD
eukprot:evm.model.scf_112.1 EVM.evm.TU.scf_112.1   scf_112:309-5683(+)